MDLIKDLPTLLNDPTTAGIRITTDYDSATGPTITPPAGTLRAGKTDVAGEFHLPDGTTAVTIDSWGSQSSRFEKALEPHAEAMGYPLIRFLDPDGTALTTSLGLSHRHADATWRMARTEIEAAGIPFEQLRDATITDADTILRYMPNAIPGGWWHSHVANKSSQKRVSDLKALGDDAHKLAGYARLGPDARSARVLTSEIIATAISRRVRMPARQDNLFGAVSGVSMTKGTIKPSELGIGSMPPMRESDGPVDVTFDNIRGVAYISFTALRRFGFTDHPDEARTLAALLALTLYAAGQHDLHLRAGAELLAKPGSPTIDILRAGQEPQAVEMPTLEQLVHACKTLGATIGWAGPIDVHLTDTSLVIKALRGSEAEDGE